MEKDVFKSKFKKIVYKKGQLTESVIWIKRLSAYDKNGSHKDAIIKAINKKKTLTDEFNQMLNKHTYDEWKERSKLISQHESKIKKVEQQIKSYKDAFIKLQNEYISLLEF